MWKLRYLKNIMYLLTKWEGWMCAITESQIFFHPAQPNLVNKYFII